MPRVRWRDIARIDRILIVISYFLRISILVAVGRAAWNHEWMLMAFSSFIFVMTFAPSFFAKNIKVNLPIELEIVAILFIYATLFLGELNEYYAIYPWWDVVLHFTGSLLSGFIGFLIVLLLYDRHKIEASAIVIAVFSFCFAMSIGAVWEILEFFLDSMFGFAMQNGSLVDTMWDLIIDVIGAFTIAAGGYFYLKGKRSYIIRPLLKRFLNKNPHLIRKE